MVKYFNENIVKKNQSNAALQCEFGINTLLRKFIPYCTFIVLISFSCKKNNIHTTTIRKVNIENRTTEHHAVVEHDANIVSKEVDLVKLPDGTYLSLMVITTKNKEKVMESLDGYTLIINHDEYYEYAEKNKKGELVGSGVRSNDLIRRFNREVKFLKNIEKHLR